MGMGEDEIQHEDPDGKSAATGGAAPQSTVTGTEVAAPCGRAPDASSTALPASAAPELEPGAADARPEGVDVAKAIPILAGERVGEPSDES